VLIAMQAANLYGDDHFLLCGGEFGEKLFLFLPLQRWLSRFGHGLLQLECRTSFGHQVCCTLDDGGDVSLLRCAPTAAPPCWFSHVCKCSLVAYALHQSLSQLCIDSAARLTAVPCWTVRNMEWTA
jgi:hypothetical protein